MTSSPVLDLAPLGFPWPTTDPFLFCAHHDDAYPAGNEALGPAVSLAGRDLGQDFSRADGFSMYHGTVVPGFPQHPHRGFETVTVVRRGFVDHSDSLGATARYGQGDVQWLTSGSGIVHAEMFPLLERDERNPLDLFQIWLNLPRADKGAPPHFSMLWRDTVPVLRFTDGGGMTTVTVVAGALGEARPPAPPPRSYAARADADVAIWTARLEPGARWTLPPARPGSRRTLYFFRGERLEVGGTGIDSRVAASVDASRPLELKNGSRESDLLVLQGRPIGEPVVQYGPFVMSSSAEINQTFVEYRRTGFGGWPFDADGPVHPRGRGRFARRPGSEEDEFPAPG